VVLGDGLDLHGVLLVELLDRETNRSIVSIGRWTLVYLSTGNGGRRRTGMILGTMTILSRT